MVRLPKESKMKKTLVLTFILLLVIIVSIQCKSKKTSAAQDTIRFRFIPSLQQNIVVTCPNLENKIYFIVDILVDTDNFQSKGLSILLNKDCNLTEAFINNIGISIREYYKFNADSFNPIMDIQMYNDIKDTCVMYELITDDIVKGDEIRIKLKYNLVESDSLKHFKYIDNRIDMKGNLFWYPRNPNKNEKVNLIIKTTDKISVSHNYKSINYNLNKYLKEYNIEFIDEADKPSSLLFRKL